MAQGRKHTVSKPAPLAARRVTHYHLRMEELMRLNNTVTISFVEALMRDAGIACFVADQNMSIIEGSIGAIPRRVMVDADYIDQARRIVTDAGLEHELRTRR